VQRRFSPQGTTDQVKERMAQWDHAVRQTILPRNQGLFAAMSVNRP
jgi:hypothetical protein